MTRGYYCLVQYCPDPGRLEGVNFGVLVYCPEFGTAGVRTQTHVHRVRRAFGRKISAKRYERLRRGFEIRFLREARKFRGLDDLQRFVGLEANDIHITEPRPVAVESLDRQLGELMNALVDDARDEQQKASVRDRLDAEFSKPEFHDLIAYNVEVHLPTIHSSLKLPYGFQNGCYHVIQPVHFQRESAAEVVARAGRYRFESELISQKDMQLVVVAEFPSGDKATPAIVERLLREKDADFYRLDEIDSLLKTIRETAKPISPPDALG